MTNNGRAGIGMYRIGVVVLGVFLLSQHAAAADDVVRGAQHDAVTGVKRSDFARVQASRDARHIADWVVDSGDNLGLPFVIVDKADARVFVFNAEGRIRGAAPALLGMARGDHSVPGIGDREYSAIPPRDRTTPAGRFVAALGMNARGEDVVWVDYDGAVSLHRVVTSKPEERRLERLATATPLDNRISYGCINLPVLFYETVLSPAFGATEGIVYVLPETRAARVLFGAYDVDERARLQDAGQATHSSTSAGSVRAIAPTRAPSIP